jgi:hypothetical protein
MDGTGSKTARRRDHLVKFCGIRENLAGEVTEFVNSTIEGHLAEADFDMQAASKAIKEHMDVLLGPPWHCTIGQNFNFDISVMKENVLYMTFAGKVGVLVWKS